MVIEANPETAVIVIIETARALENLDDIVSVPGIDVAWMGHYGLTVPLGIPAQFEHPQFLATMDALIPAAMRHNVAAGFLRATPSETVRWIRRGFRAISLASDIGLYIGAMRKFQEQVRLELAR